MKTVQVDVTLSGIVDVEVPDDVDVESMGEADYFEYMEGRINWDEAVQLLRTEIEPV